jgi:hypothetical protein
LLRPFGLRRIQSLRPAAALPKDRPRRVRGQINIIVNGDPTKDIRLLMDAEKNTDLIMKDGKIYKNTIYSESRK